MFVAVPYSEAATLQYFYRKFLEHFMLPSADKLYGDADFIFQQDLVPKAGSMTMVLLCLIGQQTRLT